MVLSLVSDKRDDAYIMNVAQKMLQLKYVEEVRLAVSGVEIVLAHESKQKVLDFIRQREITTIEVQ